MAHWNPKIVTDGLVLYLDAANTKSYPGTGTNWVDLGGNQYDGTISSSPVFENYFIDFQGTNYTLSKDIPGIYNSSNLSISVWVNFNSTAQEQGIVTKWDYPTQGTFGLQTGQGVDNGITMFIATSITDNGTGCRINSLPNIITIGNWYNIVVVFDGTLIGDSNRLKIFINKEQISLIQGSGSVPSTLTNGTAPLRIAKFDEVLSRFLNGKISNTQIYSKSLSESEIQQNFNALKSRFGL